MEAMDDIQGALGSEDRRSRVRSIGRASAVGVLVLSVLLFILFVAQIR